MRLGGRRESNNVDDRRGQRAGKVSLGIVGTIIGALIIWFLGGNPMSFITNQTISGITNNKEQAYIPTAEEEQAAQFAKQILAGTEDAWSDIFKSEGLEYKAPTMVLFSKSIVSGCGSASASTGPFYCPADQTIYIDLSFFNEMKTQLNAGGDFAYAYVIAHEVGHHVQNLLGTLGKVNELKARSTTSESNKLSVRTELQADYFAGVWAHYDKKRHKSIDDNDIRDGLNAATQIGDDRLQMQAQGYTVPDAFNHGTSKQRMRWLKKGIETGNIKGGNTFTIAYSEL